MAEAIANRHPKIEAPGALSKLFSRAIEARQKAAKWFKSSDSYSILDESNATHAHFVTILKRAAAVLRPFVKRPLPESSRHRARRQEPERSSAGVTNAFSILSVDDVDEEREGSAEYEEPLDSLPLIEPVEIQQNKSEVEAEFFFSWQGLLDQCGKVWNRLERSLRDTPDWDSSNSQTPAMGVQILQWVAQDETDWGSIARDGPDFAVPLRRALEATQDSMFEVQAKEETSLGILDPLYGFKAMAGDVCLTRLLGGQRIH